MPLIGQDHFAVPLESLPKEVILWQGGSAPQGTLIRWARWARLPLALLVMYALMLGPLFFITPSSSSPDPKAKVATEAGRNDTPPRALGTDARATEAQTRLPIAVTVAGLLLAAAVAIPWVLAGLQTRNAWYVVTSERVCVQSGALTKSLSVIDLDKVLSIEVSSSVLERRFGVETVQFIHAGGRSGAKGGMTGAADDRYVMAFVLANQGLVSNLLNHWLPRDNRRHA